MTDNRRAILDVQPTHVPLSVLNEDYQPPQPDVEVSASDLWEASKYRHWVGESLSRRQAIQEDPHAQEDYSVDFGKLVEYNDKGYTDEELKFLSASTSDENFALREERILQDKEMKKKIEAAGWKGTGIELLASIADPTMLPLMLVGAPASGAGKVSAAAKIGWSMLRGLGEGAASEYLLMQGDTQRDNSDLLMSAIAGMTFSGAIDVSKMTYKGAKNALKRADIVEDVQKKSLKEIENVQGYVRADKAYANVEPDPVVRKRALTEKEIMTELKGGRKVVSTKQRKKTESSIKKIDERIDKAKKAIKEIELTPHVGKKTKKALARTEAEKSAKITQVQSHIDELESTKAKQVSKLTDSDVVAELDKGRVPPELEAEYKRLKAERGEFDTTNSPSMKGNLPKKPKVTTDEGDVPAGSVGAMATRTEFDDIKTYDDLLTPTDVDEIEAALMNAESIAHDLPRNNKFGEVPSIVRSVSTAIDEAPDAATRGLGAMLVKNPQRTIAGHQSAEELADTLFHRAAADYLDYQNAVTTYIKEQGISPFAIGKRNAAELEFERQTVMMQVSGNLLSNKPVDGDSAVMLGAKARSRLYEQGLKNNQDYDVIGFEKIKHRHEYHSVVFDRSHLLSNEGHADNIIDCIASSYQTGAIKLSRENALRLAENQVSRSMSYGGKAHKSFDKFMSDAEYRKLEEELSAQGVSKEVIADIKESIFNKEQMGEISPRAMFSLRPNLKARSGDVWMVDLLDTSIERNMKYVSDSAANAGLASQGFRSRHQFERAVASARDAAINDLRNEARLYAGEKAGKEAEKALGEVSEGKYSDFIDDALRLLYKEPLEGHEGIKDATRMLRKSVSVLRQRSTGFMSLPETAGSAVRNGIVNTLKQIPETRMFDYRQSSVAKDKYMMDFSRAFSVTGHQEYLFGRKFYNGADFDDMTKNRLKKVDRALGTALDVTMTVNAFKMFQHGGEEMTARAIVNNIKDMAVKGEITDNVRNSLIKVGGMTDEQINKLIKVMRDNKEMDVFNAVQHLDAETHNSLATAVRNTIGHSFLRMGIGEQPAYMNKEMGKVMTTLMSFTIGSYEKMLLRGIKNERATLMAITAGQAMLGYMSLVANTYIQANNMKGRERDKYIKSKLQDEGLFWGILNRSGVFALPTTGLQMLNSMGMTPEALKGAGTLGGVQSVELVKDAARATSAVVQQATQNRTNKETDKDTKAIMQMIPWYNSTLYNLTFGVATN